MVKKNSTKILNKVRVIVYRINQKGLEIFLMPTLPEIRKGVGFIDVPMKQQQELNAVFSQNIIELEDIKTENGEQLKTIAVEGEWHDIPSIRKIIKSDIRIVKDTIKDMVPGIEHGTFFAVKEAVKEVMPEEYKALKELKEIILDRNSAKYI